MNVSDTQAAAQRSPLPTGTVTLLFTDIEGSTQHWEGRRAEMSEVLRRHDELIRGAIEACNGYVFKTVGDAFCATFWRASDGITAAVDAQRALAAEDWSAVGGLAVRMALHSGATDEREGDYFGPAVNRVARVLAAVHGGQVVVSGATQQLLRGVMPEQMELCDLGDHRLKDLVEPERVWQLVAPGLREEFPPLRSLESLPNNLPHQLTPLIGRDDVLAEIEPLVNEHALVTLVGAGGVGKTRVALQIGADLLDGSSDGVWFVELAPLTDPASVAGTIASTFGLREQTGHPILETVLHYLKLRRLLLILDNCEHVIEETARVSDTILRAAPDVRVLATSREPLRIAGEHAYRMPSLAVPSESEDLTAGAALNYGAVALFMQRALAADAKFQLTDESAPIVAEICARLDGIALAIELAAARVKVLAPRQLSQKLDERFRVLTGGSRTALPRHQTMRALIDWSYDLLTEAERKLFRRLAIFVGGWTLEAAEVVCTDETLDALDIFDLLASLTEKSLVVADLESSNPRYRLLESTRAFALEKLTQSQEHPELTHRHVEWTASLADRVYDLFWTITLEEWQREFEPELENARAALEDALATGEVALGARIASAFTGIWLLRRGEVEPRRWLDDIISSMDDIAEPLVRARTWCAKSRASFGQHKAEAAQRALELSERCGDLVGTIAALYNAAFGLIQAGCSQEGAELAERAVQLCRNNGLTGSFLYVDGLNMFAGASFGKPDVARELFGEGISLSTVLGDEHRAMMARLNLADLEFATGDVAEARRLAVEALSTARRMLDRRSQASILANLSAYALATGNVVEAHADAREALWYSRGAYRNYSTMAIQDLGAVAALRGDARRAASLLGYVDAWYRGEGSEREPTEERSYEILMAALRQNLIETEIERLAAEGAQLSEEQACAEALTISAP